MKFKIMFLTGFLIFLCFSCEEDSIIEVIETESEIIADIPLTIKNHDLNKSATKKSFSGFCTFCLSDNEKVKKCGNHIEAVKFTKGAVLILEGISNSNDIQTLQLEWGFGIKTSGKHSMKAPINLLTFQNSFSNGNLEIILDEVLIPMANEMSKHPKHSFKMKLKGDSDLSLPLSAKLKIPVVVESTSYSIRSSGL